jgi:O-antigen ligase
MLSGSHIVKLMMAMCLIAVIGVWNRYIFYDRNVYVIGFAAISLMMLIAARAGSFPRYFYVPKITLSFIVLICYAWIRLDDPVNIDLSLKESGGAVYATGISLVLDLVIYYTVFISVGVVYAKTSKWSAVYWYLVAGYIVAYIARLSMEGVQELQVGYNLGPGFVIVSLLPFVFLGSGQKKWLFPAILSLSSVIWLGLIGARTASGVILVYLIILYAWPFIVKNRILYTLFIAAVCTSIIVFNSLLLMFGEGEAGGPVVRNSEIGIFQKSLDSRSPIWKQLLYLNQDNIYIGRGMDAATVAEPALSNFEYIMRDDLSSHSLYFEIYYRIGLIGLFLFALLISMVWQHYWKGRWCWEVRVAGAYLCSALIFATTGEYLMFSMWSVWNGFGWIVLGIGSGAVLASKEKHYS